MPKPPFIEAMANPYLALVFSVAFGFILVSMTSFPGLLLVLFVHYQGKRARESNQWPAAAGRITKSQVEEYPDDFRLSIEYTYEVDDKTYTGKRIDFGTTRTFSKKADARYALKQFPYGKDFKVFYNPKNPRDSTLIRSAPNIGCPIIFAWVVLLGGFAFGLFLTYGLLLEISL